MSQFAYRTDDMRERKAANLEHLLGTTESIDEHARLEARLEEVRNEQSKRKYRDG